MSKWLDFKPDIRDGLMIVGQYDAVTDDTLYYDVYSYPSLVYEGKFHSSRFGSYEKHYDNICSYDGIYVYRELFPDVNDCGRYLERIMFGRPHLILPNHQTDITCFYSITDRPQPFRELIDKYLEIYRLKNNNNE